MTAWVGSMQCVVSDSAVMCDVTFIRCDDAAAQLTAVRIMDHHDCDGCSFGRVVLDAAPRRCHLAF